MQSTVQFSANLHDPRIGAPLSLTGPNGLTTRWEYDGFGRKTKELRADGTYITWAYQYCSSVMSGGVPCPGLSGGNSAAYIFTQSEYAATGTKMAADKINYVDALGRTLRLQSIDYNGNTVVQDSTYNALGQLVSTTQPYVPGQTVYASTSTYDKLGRLLTQNTPDPAATGGLLTVSYAYSGLSVTVTNPKGQRKTTVKNTLGQTAQVIDHDGNQVLYSYDALGQLTKTNAAGQITTMTYDQRGRKVAMSDPAMGQWTYAYNAFGELVRQTDSLSQVSTMSYDVLGRMTARNEPDLKSTWYYDKNASGTACGKSVGKLCEARADNGYRRVHSYDALGRANSTATAQDSSQSLSTVSVAFDGNTGRTVSQTWPTGYAASYTYSATGYLQKVLASGGGSPTAQLDIVAYDSLGRITSYKQGGKVTTNKNYDAATGRLLSIQAQVDGQGAGSVFKQTYSYDSLSNPTSKNDANTGVQENFGYDNLNRLTSYTSLGGSVSPPTTVQVVYDARGNIVYKSDVGRYWYDSQRPNRLTNITLESYAGAQPLAGSRALSYVFDDYNAGAQSNGSVNIGNGNLLYTVSHDSQSGKHTLRWESYTSFNMPSEVRYGNIGTTQANTVNGGTINAIVNYSCPSGWAQNNGQCSGFNSESCTITCYSCPTGWSVSGNNCTQVTGYSPAPATLTGYKCPSGFTQFGSSCSVSFVTISATATYGCPAGQTLSGISCLIPISQTQAGSPIYSCPAGKTQIKVGGAVVCQSPTTQAAGVSYSCPSGYSLSGTVCKAQSNSATTATSDRTLGFTYGPEHQRVKQVVTLTNNAPTSLMGGTTWYLHGDNNSLLYEKEVKANGITEQRHYLQAAGMTFALAVTRVGSGISSASAEPTKRPTQLSYYQQDHLGSIAAITDEAGQVIERLAYDPWGKRRYPNGLGDKADSIVGVNTDRGYTLHEHLDEVGVIHMNGRVYDPLIGRFMSADPFVQSPGNLQSYNRYAYVMNNPLVFTDPSGYFSLGGLMSSIDNVRRDVIRQTGQGINAVLEPLPGWAKGVAIGAASVVACGPYAPACAAAGVGASAYGAGASSSDALRAGAIVGGTAYAFSLAGDVYANDPTAGYAAHAGVGCASSVASGAGCAQGATAAVFGKYTTVTIGGYFNTPPGQFNGYQMAATMVAGGVGSAIAGGKFENGAKTAAFGYLFNYLAHLQVDRMYTTERGTYSRFSLYADDKLVYSGFGVEPIGNAGLGFDRVAPGTYDLAPEFSGRFGADTLTVQNPFAEGSGRQMSVVRIHSGNFPQHTEGCYVPGTGLSFDQVSGSGAALTRIRAEMFAPGVTARSITYTNPTSTRWYVPGGRF